MREILKVLWYTKTYNFVYTNIRGDVKLPFIFGLLYIDRNDGMFANDLSVLIISDIEGFPRGNLVEINLKP